MVQHINISALLEHLLHARIRNTTHSNVFDVRFARLFLRRKVTEQDAGQLQLIRELQEHYPLVFFWSKDHDEHELAALGMPHASSGGARVWRIQNDRLPDLSAGGWALFFMRGDLTQPLSVPGFLPTEPAQTVALLATVGAGAAILSWYDNMEWLVAHESSERAAQLPGN